MIAALLMLMMAHAGDDAETCKTPDFPGVEGVQSVVWVSRSRTRIRASGWVTVVPARDLRAWVHGPGGGSLGRMLQMLGLRKRSTTPKGRWKVVVFEAAPGALCRPIEGHEEPLAISGVLTCSVKASLSAPELDGCGVSTDRGSEGAGLVQFRARWSDLARDGFCVLPAERFVAGS